jgi:hypothetical protein
MLNLGWAFPLAMASIHEISDQVSAFLANRISLEQLEDWSAEYSWNIHTRADGETQKLVYQIRAILNAYSDESQESVIRQELAAVVRPFAEQPEILVSSCELMPAKGAEADGNRIVVRLVARSATRSIDVREKERPFRSGSLIPLEPSVAVSA